LDGSKQQGTLVAFLILSLFVLNIISGNKFRNRTSIVISIIFLFLTISLKLLYIFAGSKIMHSSKPCFMKKIFLVLSTFYFSASYLSGFSQISQGGLPLSFQNPQLLSKNVAVVTMPQVDVKQLMAEDSVNEVYKDVPWRFGENIAVNLDLNNSGTWEILQNGDRIWRLGIKCPGAYTINLAFDNYHLPPGATLFVYNIDKTQVIGAFTDFNNREDSAFATTLVKGEEIVIEYSEPQAPVFSGELHLNRVTHGYRDSFGYIKSFGQSGSCNNNVHCPEADAWQNQVKSACMLVTNGNGFCSGALVNNTSQNGVPYILTANHCYSNPSTWVFWFNWESPTCTNPSSSPPYNSISGATLRARYSDSDFCLVEMSSVPPASYTVYYAGWNRKDSAASSGACIHHPSGDIKKISYSNTPFHSDTWSGTPPDSHWRVDWSDGVTEPGSSGSPMFDQNHQIVGQLHGGPSACNASQLWDFFGKFAMSWEHGTTPATRLKEWLDPTNIAGDTLGGFDPNQVTTVTTLPATGISGTLATLNGIVTPNGNATNYHFDWGTSTSFGNTTSPQSAGSGSLPVNINALLSGLTQGMQYFFRAVGTTSSATIYGDTLNFVTIIPELTVTPPNRDVGTSPGNTQFFVTSNINWTVISGSDWCTVTPSGSGNDTIFATFTENTSATPRVALISVTGEGGLTKTVTVSQEGIPVILTVTPPNRNVTSTNGVTNFSVTSNTSWTVVSDTSWITVTPSGTGNDSIHVTFTENPAITERVAHITVSAAGIASVTVTVTQSGAPLMLNVTPLIRNVSALPGNTSFTVTSNTTWTVISDTSWCTVTSGGSGNGTIAADYTENTAYQARTANISVTATGLPVQIVIVNQAKSTIGIGEHQDGELRIYPNPTKGIFKIVPVKGNNSDLDVQVVDMDGRIILKKQYSGKKEYDVDLSSASAGSYQIIIKTDNNLVIRKLVIMK
jgi:hypothetical protein